MRTAELTGITLDWAVAKCEGVINGNALDVGFILEFGYTPSTDWEQGGAIIECERLSITPRDGYWEAYYHDNLFKDDGSDYFKIGTTPLIAAMRCYVASKMGDYIEVPKELQGETA